MTTLPQHSGLQRVRRTRPKTLLLAFTLLAALHCLVITGNWGPGVTTDSVRYIATARHLSAGLGLVTHTGAPLVEHPPLYPVLLSAIERLAGVDPLVSARFVGAALMGAVVFAGGLLLLGYLRRMRWLGLVLAAHSAVSLIQRLALSRSILDNHQYR